MLRSLVVKQLDNFRNAATMLTFSNIEIHNLEINLLTKVNFTKNNFCTYFAKFVYILRIIGRLLMQMAHRAGFKYWKTDNNYNMWKTLKFSGDMQTIFRYSPTHPPYTEADSYNHRTHTYIYHLCMDNLQTTKKLVNS